MTKLITPETNTSSNNLGLPPPLDIELSDGDRVVGWLTDDALGFRGFADEVEAVHASWVASRALARRTARRLGERPIPVGTEPLAIRDDGDEETITAGGRRIGRLVRPGPESRTGPDSFGFELPLPVSAHEVNLRAKAHVVYRTLRKSGIRWGMWRPPAVSKRAPRPDSAPVRGGVVSGAPAADATPRVAGRPPVMSFVVRMLLTAVTIVLGGALMAIAPLKVVVPIAVVLLAAIIATGVAVRVERRRAPSAAMRSAAARSAAARSTIAVVPGADAPVHRQPQGVAARDSAGAVGGAGVAGQGALAAVSVALLALAFAVPRELAIALIAIGLAGLFILRVAMTRPGDLSGSTLTSDPAERGSSHYRHQGRPA